MRIRRYFFAVFVLVAPALAAEQEVPCDPPAPGAVVEPIARDAATIARAVVATERLPIAERCGGPLAGLALPEGHRGPVPDLRPYLRKHSGENMARLRASLGTLSPTEQQIAAKVKEFGVPIVHRLPLPKLREVLKSGELISAREMERRSGQPAATRTHTFEKQLFAGSDCVYVTVGTPYGDSRYGEAAIRFKKQPAGLGWGTPMSGWGFMTRVQGGASRGVTDEDRKELAKTAIIDTDFEEYFSLTVVSQWRKLPAAVREKVAEQLLDAYSAAAFWRVGVHNRLGYLEGRYEGTIPVESIEAIEVPAASAEEVKRWPEATAIKSKVVGYTKKQSR